MNTTTVPTNSTDDVSSRPASQYETHFEEQGSLMPPKLIGRIVRFLLGAWLLTAVYPMADALYGWIALGFWDSTTPPRGLMFYLLVAFAFWATPHVINIGFTKNWRRGPQWVIASVAAALVGVDLAAYGTWWSGPLAVFVYLWLLYIAVHLGLSLVLSSIIATPGCEMRAVPHLWTIVTRRSTREHYCPGWLDRLDRWERSKP